MVKREYYETQEDITLYRYYSDNGLCLLQNETGNIYVEAIDREDKPFTYKETVIKIED